VTLSAGLLSPIRIDTQNGLAGTSATPSLPVTTTIANELLIGMVGVEGTSADAYTEDTPHQWTSLAGTGTTGGTPDTNVTINGVYRAAGTTGTYTYAPVLGTSSNWIEFPGGLRSKLTTPAPAGNTSGWRPGGRGLLDSLSC
jgi:hypothetical protein